MSNTTIETVNTPKPNFDFNTLLQALKYRYATKKFDGTKDIPKDQFDNILEAARLSPTSFGLETWKLVVVDDMAVRQELKKFAWGAQDALDNASKFVVILANKRQDLKFGSAYMDHMLKDVHQVPDEVYNFYKDAYTNFGENTYKTFESERAAFDWSARQGYIVMANMMVAAAYQGIDSCALEGIIPAEFDRILGEEQKVFDTAHYGVAAAVAFGYRNETPHRDKSRRPLSESVLWK